MLTTSVFIYSPSDIGGGLYTIELYFSPSSQAKHLRINDIIKDSLNRKYKVTTWVGYSSDNFDGNVVTVQYLDLDVAPQESVSFDAKAYTPGQIDIKPRVQTDGAIGSSSVISGQQYEYQLLGSWTISAEANKALVGDHIADKNGKIYEITFIDPTNRFAVPFRMKEIEKEGIIPPDGTATMYSPTPNLELFQGEQINNIATKVVRNRDTLYQDLAIDQVAIYVNGYGSIITKGQVTYESSVGYMSLARADLALTPGTVIGIVASDSIANSDPGNFYIKSGIVVSGFTSLSVNLPVYLSKTVYGGIQQNLTGFNPGDHVVKIGTALSTTDILFDPIYDFEY